MNAEMYDPFLAFEQDAHIEDLQTIFAEELTSILSKNTESTALDELFGRVDTLLNTASEMLDYQQYLNIVQMAMNCGAHAHGIESMLQKSRHGLAANDDHHHDDDDEHDSAHGHTGRTLLRWWSTREAISKKKFPGLLELLMGVK